MYDTAKIMLGIFIFLAISTSPFWFNQATGQSDYMPDPVIYTKNIPGQEACVMSVDFMKSSHMDLLNKWRQTVVREGNRIFVSPDGKEYRMSLSNTCKNLTAGIATFSRRRNHNGHRQTKIPGSGRIDYLRCLWKKSTGQFP
jgi:hypothetical protein